MKVTLTRVTGDPVLAIEEAACNCYDSTPSLDGKIMAHCIKSGHTSVTEFCNFTFHIEGVSRALLAQLTRHRHAGYAVRSQRYCSSFGDGWAALPKANGIKSHQSQHFCNNQEEFLVNIYNKGYSCAEIGEIYNIPPTTINGIIKKYQPMRSLSETKGINENYFDTIDSNIKAYILGLIYADGCIAVHDRQSNQYELCIDQKSDEEVLMNNILNQFKTNGNLIRFSDRDIIRVAVCSDKICNDLIKYGITPQKGLTITFDRILNNVPHQYVKEVIRGIFEGDGHIDIHGENNNDARFDIAGTINTCEAIQNILIKELGLSKTKIQHISNNCYKLTYGGKPQVTKIVEWLYSDSNLVFTHSKKMSVIVRLSPKVFNEYKKQIANYISTEFECITPPSYFQDLRAINCYITCLEYCRKSYKQIQKSLATRGKYGEESNEDARYILPNACETKLEVTMNLRALMNFMNERLCTCAQWEIRQLARIMRDLIIEQFPQFAPYLVPKCEKYGKDKGFCNEPKKRSCGRHPLLSDIMEDYRHYQDLCNS